MCQAESSENEQEQTLRLFEECMKHEREEMQDQRQASRRYWMELEVETEVPLEVSRKVPSDVRAEMYMLVDKVWTTVKLLMLETDPELWPNSPFYCPDLLDMVMDQLGIKEKPAKEVMINLMQITEPYMDQLEINGGPAKEVMINLLQMTEADKTQTLIAMDAGDRRLITMISDVAATCMLQRLSEHGAWSIKGTCKNTGVSNAQLEMERKYGLDVSLEMSAGQYAALAGDYGEATYMVKCE